MVEALSGWRWLVSTTVAPGASELELPLSSLEATSDTLLWGQRLRPSQRIRSKVWKSICPCPQGSPFTGFSLLLAQKPYFPKSPETFRGAESQREKRPCPHCGSSSASIWFNNLRFLTRLKGRLEGFCCSSYRFPARVSSHP